MTRKSFNDIKTPVGKEGYQASGAIFNNNVYVRGFFALEIHMEDGTVELHNAVESWLAKLDDLLINGVAPRTDSVVELEKQFEPFTNEGAYTLSWDDVGGNIYSNGDLTEYFIASNKNDSVSGEGDIKNIYKEIILKNPDDCPTDTTFLRGQGIIRSYGAFFTDLADPRNSVAMSAYGPNPVVSGYRPQIDVRASDGGHIIIKPTVIHLEDPDGKFLDIDTNFSGGGGGGVTPQDIIDNTIDSQTVSRFIDPNSGKVQFTAIGGGSTGVVHDYMLLGEGTAADPLTLNEYQTLPRSIYGGWRFSWSDVVDAAVGIGLGSSQEFYKVRCVIPDLNMGEFLYELVNSPLYDDNTELFRYEFWPLNPQGGYRGSLSLMLTMEYDKLFLRRDGTWDLADAYVVIASYDNTSSTWTLEPDSTYTVDMCAIDSLFDPGATLTIRWSNHDRGLVFDCSAALLNSTDFEVSGLTLQYLDATYNMDYGYPERYRIGRIFSLGTELLPRSSLAINTSNMFLKKHYASHWGDGDELNIGEENGTFRIMSHHFNWLNDDEVEINKNIVSFCPYTDNAIFSVKRIHGSHTSSGEDLLTDNIFTIWNKYDDKYQLLCDPAVKAPLEEDGELIAWCDFDQTQFEIDSSSNKIKVIGTGGGFTPSTAASNFYHNSTYFDWQKGSGSAGKGIGFQEGDGTMGKWGYFGLDVNEDAILNLSAPSARINIDPYQLEVWDKTTPKLFMKMRARLQGGLDAEDVVTWSDFSSTDFEFDSNYNKIILKPAISPIITLSVDYAEMDAGDLTEHVLADPPVGSRLLGTWTLSSGVNLLCKGPEVCIFSGVDENGVQQDIQYTLHNKHAVAIPAGKVIFTFM